jgi:putative glutamine amidotransferase
MNNSIPLIGLSCGLHPRGPDGNRPHASTAIAYARALLDVGAIGVIIPPLQYGSDFVNRLDGLILTGGSDIEPSLYGQNRNSELMEPDKLRDDPEVYLAKVAFKMDIPVLGICRGIQLINVALGGTLWQDIATQVTGSLTHSNFPTDWDACVSHYIRLTTDSKLSEIFKGREKLKVNSAHHQAIRDLGANLRITALAPDGLIEAIESTSHKWVIGVQWHPEMQSVSDLDQRDLFAAFVLAAKQKRGIS